MFKAIHEFQAGPLQTSRDHTMRSGYAAAQPVSRPITSLSDTNYGATQIDSRYKRTTVRNVAKRFGRLTVLAEEDLNEREM